MVYGLLGIPLLLECLEGLSGLGLIRAAVKDAPDSREEGANAAHFGVGLADLNQLGLLFIAHPFFGFEQEVAILPERARKLLQPSLIPGGVCLLRVGCDFPAAADEELPDVTPDVLDDMEEVELDLGIGEDLRDHLAV